MLQNKAKKWFVIILFAALVFQYSLGCGTKGASLQIIGKEAEKVLDDGRIKYSGYEKADEPEPVAAKSRELETEEIPFKVEQPSEEQWIYDQMQKMTLEDKIYQLFFVSPEALTGYRQVTAAGETTKKALEKCPVGGIIYFSQNLQNESQTKRMLKNVEGYAKDQHGIPLFLGVDEEGGRVARIGNHPNFSVKKLPAMGQIGQGKDTNEAYRAGETIGAYLFELGFNLDFAPDADVLSNPENTAIGDRSFGADPQMVSEMVSAFSNGLSNYEIIPCVKHFPGHGGTTGDTHNGFAYTEKKKDELMRCELVPFIEAVENDFPMIMVSHVSAPEITGDNTPASLSYEMITGMLRGEMGYDGIVITDALEMDAITEHYGVKEAAVLALQAGCDMLLMSREFHAAYKAVYDAVADGRISHEQIDNSVKRILCVKYRKCIL